MRTYLLPLYTLLLLTLTGPAHAVDGVLEINQTCAVNTGCFAGDTAGFPVEISVSGSYRLTSNLVVPDENTTGIEVGTTNVGIDLNQFAIIGPVVCSTVIPFDVVCTPSSGTGIGVTKKAVTAVFSISVRNGSIRGMGKHGVFLDEHTEIKNLRVRSNGDSGVFVGPYSTVSDSLARLNGGNGIRACIASTVLGNSSTHNADYGIKTCDSCVISNNATTRNGLSGIQAGAYSTISNNTASYNHLYGIFSGEASIISGNTVYRTLGTGDGIGAGAGSSVHNNVSRTNDGYGLFLLTDATYRENTITGNLTGPITGSGGSASGVNLGSNYCAGTGVVSATCP